MKFYWPPKAVNSNFEVIFLAKTTKYFAALYSFCISLRSRRSVFKVPLQKIFVKLDFRTL